MSETNRETASAPELIFDWSRRHGPASRLPLFLIVACLLHVAGFYLIAVRMPPPARAVPLPFTIALAEGAPVGQIEGAARPFPLSVPVPAAGLDLAPLEVPTGYVPSYESRALKLEPWPEKPSPLAWPDVSGVRPRPSSTENRQ